MIRNYNTLSRTSMQLPHEEFRVNVPKSNPWHVFIQINEDVAKVYYLVVNNVISNSKEISLEELERILKFKYSLPTNIVHDFIRFIIVTVTKDIEFETINNICKPVIYRKPMQKLSAVGPCSRYTPKP